MSPDNTDPRAPQDVVEPGAEEFVGGRGPGADPASLGFPPAEPAPAPTADATVQRETYLRLAAEYDNYRKRTERERGDAWVRAQAQLVEKLIDPLDDLKRVAHYTADRTTVEALLEGVHLVERKLIRALEAAGLETVGHVGERFDPQQEEAIMTAPAATREEDETVGEVLQTGYRFKGTLLRPARVQVKKYGG